ncbi:hypothetical protein [Bradyrhizobium sp. SZCCHNR3015]|uniref:hypothetical protein n=1 Tax=Bradyrhizobium sp. SZCCHNR3015 TaxID=3057395 RepID=UPI0029166456|nr:hypothetical protein [Bradyrhizobium sp. SZCCHNR3015]
MISPEAIERRRERDRLKKQRKRDRIRAGRAKALAAGPKSISKTSAAYREIRFGRVPEMSKAQMRAEIARAVENTRGLTVVDGGADASQ